MAGYTFAYTEITIPPSDPFPSGQQILRPYLTAQLRVASTGATFRCFVWPDSGADHCTFPLSFAQAMGLDPLKMKMHMTGGVGSVANPTYYADLEIEIPVVNQPSLHFTTYAGFTAGMEAQGIGLLGQAGFFESFHVAFDHKAKAFTVVER